MIKKALYIIGLGGLGYAGYYYFNNQFNLALDWEFKVKDLYVKRFDKQGAEFDFTLSILNKSSFNIEVQNYDIDLLYEGMKVANSTKNEQFKVSAQSWFDIDSSAVIDFGSVTSVLDEFGVSLLKNEPLILNIKGELNLKMYGLSKKIIFNNQEVVVSENISKTLGVNKPIGQLTNFLDDLGISF